MSAFKSALHSLAEVSSVLTRSFSLHMRDSARHPRSISVPHRTTNPGAHCHAGAEASSLPITKVRPRQCRYIVDDDTFPALCCAAPTRPGTSWCEHHCNLVYRVRSHRTSQQRP